MSSTALCSVLTVTRCLPRGLVELRRALEREVVGLGRARGPDDLARVGADQRGDLLARLLDRLLRFPAPGMAARRRVAEVLAQPRDHRVDDALIDRRRRAVVHVDREMRGHVHGRKAGVTSRKPLPSANTEFGAVILIGLTTGCGRDRPLDRVLLDRHALGELLVDQLLQRHRVEELDHLGVQAGPQVVRHAAAGVVAHAVFLAGAAGGVDRLVDRDDDVGDGDLLGLAAERIAAARAAGALDELVPAQLAEQLLQVGQRDLLPRADRRQGDRAGVLAQGQIDHRGDGETAFGGQTHGNHSSGSVSDAAGAGRTGNLAKTEPPSRLFLSRPI